MPPTLPTGKKRKNSQDDCSAGFTLVEIIVVLALIGILAAFVRPSLGLFGKGHAVRTSIHALASLLRYAQSEAIAGGHVIRVAIDVNAGRVRVERLPARDSGEETVVLRRWVASGGVSVASLTVDEDATESAAVSPERYLSFYPDGTAERAILSLEGGPEDAPIFADIVVNPLTGWVGIEDASSAQAAPKT